MTLFKQGFIVLSTGRWRVIRLKQNIAQSLMMSCLEFQSRFESCMIFFETKYVWQFIVFIVFC